MALGETSMLNLIWLCKGPETFSNADEKYTCRGKAALMLQEASTSPLNFEGDKTKCCKLLDREQQGTKTFMRNLELKNVDVYFHSDYTCHLLSPDKRFVCFYRTCHFSGKSKEPFQNYFHLSE